MLAAHADQENLIHGQQTAAAAKSLNRSFGAKTPGNARAPKTPFKIPLNDENAPFRANGKSAVKTLGGKENVGTVGTKGGKLDQSAFVTPAGPRNRAPLGFKTTNAKATAFQTPVPSSTQTKTISPRLRRKVKIHQPEPVSLEEQDDVPEPEYMPPRSVPLPDVPSDDEDFLSPSHEFPQFAPENMTRGWVRHYMNPIGDDGVSYLDKKDAREKEEHDKHVDEMLEKAMNEAFADTEEALREDMGISPKKSAAEQSGEHSPVKPKPVKHAPGTVMAKSAASVLNKPTKSVPSYAASTSTAAAKAKTPSTSGGLFGKKIRESAKAETASTNRHGAALVASRSTLGYGRGRAVSQKINNSANGATQLQNLHKPRSLSASGVDGKQNVTPARAAALRAREVEEELRLRTLAEEDELDVLETFGVPEENWLDDEYDGFQLELGSLN